MVFATAARVRIMLHIRKDLDRSKNVSAARVDELSAFLLLPFTLQSTLTECVLDSGCVAKVRPAAASPSDYRTSCTMRWNILMARVHHLPKLESDDVDRSNHFHQSDAHAAHGPVQQMRAAER